MEEKDNFRYGWPFYDGFFIKKFPFTNYSILTLSLFIIIESIIGLVLVLILIRILCLYNLIDTTYLCEIYLVVKKFHKDIAILLVTLLFGLILFRLIAFSTTFRPGHGWTIDWFFFIIGLLLFWSGKVVSDSNLLIKFSFLFYFTAFDIFSDVLLNELLKCFNLFIKYDLTFSLYLIGFHIIVVSLFLSYFTIFNLSYFLSILNFWKRRANIYATRFTIDYGGVFYFRSRGFIAPALSLVVVIFIFYFGIKENIPIIDLIIGRGGLEIWAAAPFIIIGRSIPNSVSLSLISLLITLVLPLLVDSIKRSRFIVDIEFPFRLFSIYFSLLFFTLLTIGAFTPLTNGPLFTLLYISLILLYLPLTVLLDLLLILGVLQRRRDLILRKNVLPFFAKITKIDDPIFAPSRRLRWWWLKSKKEWNNFYFLIKYYIVVPVWSWHLWPYLKLFKTFARLIIYLSINLISGSLFDLVLLFFFIRGIFFFLTLIWRLIVGG